MKLKALLKVTLMVMPDSQLYLYKLCLIKYFNNFFCKIFSTVRNITKI